MIVEVPASELPEWIGKETEPTPWFEMEQARINAFADATLDHQFIHIDTEKAKQTPFGTTIAHGFLTLSLLPHFLGQTGVMPAGVTMAVNYGLNKVRFLNPVKVGSNIRAHIALADVKERKPGEYLLTKTVTVEIEGEETPAMVAETLMLLFVQ